MFISLCSESRRNSLETNPIAAHLPHGKIPNTPLASSTIAFLLGGLFALGTYTFLFEPSACWWMTYQLGYFIAAWAFFHWAEFAVTAGWNSEKCSVDCTYASMLHRRAKLIDFFH
jgi:protein-S-isoprenylcysteine O-methyltransferase